MEPLTYEFDWEAVQPKVTLRVALMSLFGGLIFVGSGVVLLGDANAGPAMAYGSIAFGALSLGAIPFSIAVRKIVFPLYGASRSIAIDDGGLTWSTTSRTRRKAGKDPITYRLPWPDVRGMRVVNFADLPGIPKPGADDALLAWLFSDIQSHRLILVEPATIAPLPETASKRAQLARRAYKGHIPIEPVKGPEIDELFTVLNAYRDAYRREHPAEEAASKAES